MADFSRFAGYMSGTSARKAGEFIRTLTPKKGSIGQTARQIGYTVIFYVGSIAITVVAFSIWGVFSFALLIALIPLLLFMSFRLAQAARAAEETNGHGA